MIASLLFASSYRRFLSSCDRPFEAQAASLRRILRQAARTGIALERRFTRLAELEDSRKLVAAFQERVPVRTHGQMRAELEAVREGSWQALCPSRPLFFAMTAGSTGTFKYLPVTPEFRHELAAGSLIVSGAMEAACPPLRGLRTQFLVGSAEGGLSPAGIPQGFASGFNYRSLPRFVRRKFVLPYWPFTLDDAEDRAYAAGRMLVAHGHLGALCAISPVNLTNVKLALERNVNRLLADIHCGTLTVHGTAAVPGEFRTRPQPGLANLLRRAWRETGSLPTRLLFPSLRVLMCWQGGNMSCYLDELRENFPGTDLFEFPTSASEGLFAIPFRLNEPGGIVAITSHFLEFLPEGETNPVARTADQLEVGQEYRLVVTNAGGLYRYDMEDIVRVTGFHRRTPIIVFVSKAGRRVSVANERLSERDVTVAMEHACRRAGLRCGEFLFVPCSDRRYRVLLDGSLLRDTGESIGDRQLEHLAAELERALRLAARGYDFEREDALLEPLEVMLSLPGELRALTGPRPEQTRIPNAQIKPIHLTPEFDAHRRLTAARTYAA
jgi:hypothetical protein